MAIYVSEYPNSKKDCTGATISPADTFNTNRLFLLMVDRVYQGKPNAVGGKIGMWRLDFYDATTKTYLDIKRNHTYTFTINKIRSMPYYDYFKSTDNIENILTTATYNTEYQVWNNPGSNIEYAISIEEDWANVIYSNGQYALSISSTDTIKSSTIPPLIIKAHILPEYKDHIRDHLIHMYTINNGISGNPSNNGLVFEDYTPSPIVADGGFNLSTDGTIDTVRIIYKPKADDAAHRNGYMIIRFGNIQKTIHFRIP
jgi:hypothetical protein